VFNFEIFENSFDDHVSLLHVRVTKRVRSSNANETTIQVKLSNGTPFRKRFRVTDHIEDVVQFAKDSGETLSSFHLVLSSPRKSFQGKNPSLQEAGPFFFSFLFLHLHKSLSGEYIVEVKNQRAKRANTQTSKKQTGLIPNASLMVTKTM